jgi:hypothetical protein
MKFQPQAAEALDFSLELSKSAMVVVCDFIFESR